MKRKIFNAIWCVAVLVFLASLIFILGVSYGYFSRVQAKQLKIETQLASQGVAMSGMDFLLNLDAEDYRVTWIDHEGNVIYDDEADTSNMENHLEREEIKEALAEGYGESVRYSSTLAEKQLYSAMRLPDGSVLRLSIVQMAVWTLFLGFAQPICLVILIALILSLILASGLTKKILEPINSIDPDNPMLHFNDEDYKEIAPLLQRIHYQQEQLKRDQKEIQKAALIRQEFTANVSHELKTPLHVISGSAELLEKGMVRDEDLKIFSGKILNESRRMTVLVEDIIDLTKLDEGGAELIWEECDLRRISENALDSLAVSADRRKIRLELQGDSTVMCGVSKLLYSIVYNLCDNAVKYNRENGKVTIRIEDRRKSALIIVKDTGIGIPEDCLDRIFERFYRVDKSRSKEAGGTGLGLSIVKHAVMIHKGKVTVSSRVGQGSEFYVTMPKERPFAEKPEDSSSDPDRKK